MSNTNMNQQKSFWDFIQQIQNNPAAFPFAEGRGQEGEFDPFAWGQFGGPGSHRGRRHGHPGHGHRGPPPPPPPPPGPHGPHHGYPPVPPPPGPHGPHHGYPPVPPPPGPHGPHHDYPRGPPPPGPPLPGPPPPGPPPPGPHGPHHDHPRGPPPPPEYEGSAPPPPEEEPIARSPTPPTPPETPAEPGHHPDPHREHHHRGPSPHHRRGGPCRGRGGFGGRGGHDGARRGNANFPFDLNALAEAFAPALFGSWDDGNTGTANNNNTSTEVGRKNEDGSFTPEVDVFDTTSAYIIHASLPGAKKPDLDITYTAARNSVSISGVVMRPGVDEALMSTLAQDERKVGSFQREIKLDEKVKIDEDGITAKLEDGVLRVTVPKVLEEEEEYVTVKRVPLE